MIYNGMTVQQVLEVFQEEGFSVKILDESDKHVTIESGVGGYRFIVLLEHKNARGEYETLQFWIGWGDTVAPQAINDWNRARRFVYAYYDQKNHPILQQDISLLGVTREFLRFHIVMWRNQVGNFVREIA